MSRELVIEGSPFGLRAALLEDGRLIEVGFADQNGAGQGDIHLGRVRAVDRELQAAFVDVGLGEDGWLDARDAGGPKSRPLSRRLNEGQAVLVQMRRGAAGGKGVRLTTDVALVGPALVFRPRRRGTNLSARLARSPAAAAQRARARGLSFQGGITLRTGAAGVSDAELTAEATMLEQRWERIEMAAGTTPPPACIEAIDPMHRLMVEHLPPDPDRISVDDPATLARTRAWIGEWRPRLVERLDRNPDAFEASGAAEQLAAALEPTVPLAAGGSLIIQSTAALTAIDVDGGGRAALEANLDAAREVARQLRLRRIGGTAVVDFIDLAARAERARLHEVLCAAFAEDPAEVQVFSPSRLGLVEISRQRTGPSLAEILGRPCPTCGGDGMTPSLRCRAEDLMAQLASPRARRRAHLAPDLHGFLTGAGAPAWRSFLERHGLVVLATDPSLGPGDHRIEEMGS